MAYCRQKYLAGNATNMGRERHPLAAWPQRIHAAKDIRMKLGKWAAENGPDDLFISGLPPSSKYRVIGTVNLRGPTCFRSFPGTNFHPGYTASPSALTDGRSDS